MSRFLDAPWHEGKAGLVLLVRLTPKGGRDALEGETILSDGRRALQARVRAVPEKGAANRALIALLAAAAGRPKSAVGIVSGETARLKEIAIEGDAAEIAARLAALVTAGGK